MACCRIVGWVVEPAAKADMEAIKNGYAAALIRALTRRCKGAPQLLQARPSLCFQLRLAQQAGRVGHDKIRQRAA